VLARLALGTAGSILAVAARAGGHIVRCRVLIEDEFQIYLQVQSKTRFTL